VNNLGERTTSALGLVLSSILSYVAYYWLFGKQGYTEHTAAMLAALLLISVLLHEAGHWAVLEKCGIKSHVVVLVIIGGAGPNKPEDFIKLNRKQIVYVVLAGPAMNLVLALTGLLLWQYTDWSSAGLALASLNAGLAAFNLLPLFILDGKRFLMAVLESTNDKVDKQIVDLGVATALIAGVLVFAFHHTSVLPLLLLAGFIRSNGQDDPKACQQKTAMSLSDAFSALFYWGLMWGACFALYIILPDWVAAYTR
jgi:Zn-dependent protease